MNHFVVVSFYLLIECLTCRVFLHSITGINSEFQTTLICMKVLCMVIFTWKFVHFIFYSCHIHENTVVLWFQHALQHCCLYLYCQVFYVSKESYFEDWWDGYLLCPRSVFLSGHTSWIVSSAQPFHDLAHMSLFPFTFNSSLWSGCMRCVLRWFITW